MKDSRSRVLCVTAAALMLIPVLAAAQTQDFFPEDSGGQYEFDTTVAPLVVPAAEDFAAPAERTAGPVAGPVGVSTFFDVTSDIKSGVLTPFYRVSRALAFKAHVPLIFNSTRHYFNFDAEGSGLGDITVDTEYTMRRPDSGAEFRFQASVKLPTGDQDNTDADATGFEYPVPLGTGTVDFMARGQYARSTADTGLLASALYRMNSGDEIVSDLGSVIQTDKVTAANLGVISLFARHRVSGSWWLHLGASTMLTGDGKVETSWSDGTPGGETSLAQGGTLVDIFPGISYDLGALKPYVGARIPVVTSYDNVLLDDNRDTAFIFQFSYRPGSLAD